MDVFFVISGFLITGLLWREVNSTGTVRLRHFYGARARRLLPASATVGVITLIGSAVLLPPLRARTAFGDGITSALYVSNYRFLLQGVDYSAPAMPLSPFQHYWSLGVEEQFYLVWPALIIGTAWLIRRARRRTRADATYSSQRPYLVVLALVAAVSFALSLAACYWAPSVAFFSLPTRAWQLAVGGLVVLTAGQWRRLPPHSLHDRGMDWAGPDPAGLHPLQHGRRYIQVSAALLPTAGCGAGDRRWLWRTCPGMRPRAGVVADARDRPDLLLVVSVALAGAGTRTTIDWPPAGAGRQVGGGAGVRRAGGAHLAFHREPAALRRSGSPVSPGAVWRWVVSPPRSRPWVGLALLVVVPTPVGRGAPAAALTVTAAPVPAGSTMEAYDAAVQHAFAQVQAAVAASADLKAVPSNLNPPLADAAAELNDLFRYGCMRSAWQVRQPECATGDTASSTTVAVVGDSDAAMWNPAFRHGRRAAALAAGDADQSGLPIDGPADHQPPTSSGVHRVRAVAWRDHGPAARRAPAAGRGEHVAAIRCRLRLLRQVSRPTTRRGSTAWLASCSSCAASAPRCWCSGRSRIPHGRADLPIRTSR